MQEIKEIPTLFCLKYTGLEWAPHYMEIYVGRIFEVKWSLGWSGDLMSKSLNRLSH